MSAGLRAWAARQFPLVLPLILLLIAWPWAVIGLAGLLPVPRLGRFLAGCVIAGGSIWACAHPDVQLWTKLAIVAIPILFMLWVVFLRKPGKKGAWVPTQERMPVARFDGDRVTIENFRHTVYRSLDDFDVHYIDKSFDLSRLDSVDFLVVPFAAWRGFAHVFVSFGFSDGDHLAVSVEARREAGQPYSMLGGLFAKYEVIYVLGDERDVVGRRAVYENHPVHLYPLIAEPEGARALLESMLRAATDLAERPQSYHTLTNTCTSNVLVHATRLENRPRRYDFRLVFPGYSDGLAVETGLLEAPDGLEALRAASLINEAAQRAPLDDGVAWSAAIRAGRAGPAAIRASLEPR